MGDNGYDSDESYITSAEYIEHVRVNKFSYRLPIITDYIKNKLCVLPVPRWLHWKL